MATLLGSCTSGAGTHGTVPPPRVADVEHARQPEYVKRMLQRRLARKRKAERKWSSAFGYARR